MKAAELIDGKALTGIPGLDYLLRGGLPVGRIHLIEGDPAAGKTTLGMQFLLEGLRQGESCMYITLSETEDELRSSAASHGWSLDGIHIQQVQPSENLRSEDQYTLFYPSAISSYARREDKQRALTAGFNEHLAKPVQPDELFKTIERIWLQISHAMLSNADADAKIH